jgi:hypothetical protein
MPLRFRVASQVGLHSLLRLAAALPYPAAPEGPGEVAAHLMGRMTAEVQALLQERQVRRKAELDAPRREVQFVVCC